MRFRGKLDIYGKSFSNDRYLHVSDVQVLPDVGGDDVSQLFQVGQGQEVGQVAVAPLHILVDPGNNGGAVGLNCI